MLDSEILSPSIVVVNCKEGVVRFVGKDCLTKENRMYSVVILTRWFSVFERGWNVSCPGCEDSFLQEHAWRDSFSHSINELIVVYLGS